MNDERLKAFKDKLDAMPIGPQFASKAQLALLMLRHSSAPHEIGMDITHAVLHYYRIVAILDVLNTIAEGAAKGAPLAIGFATACDVFLSEHRGALDRYNNMIGLLKDYKPSAKSQTAAA